MFVGKTIRCLSLFVRKSPLYAGLSVALEVGAALLLPLNLYLMSRLIETAVMGGVDFGIAALFAVTALVQVVISYYKKKLSLLLGFEMSHTMQRAFLEKCSRLSFEAFANEDALNLLTLAEEAADGGVMELFSGKTTFIVTHRLAICPRVDRVILLEKGRITASGSHQELLKISSVYREMYESQSNPYL